MRSHCGENSKKSAKLGNQDFTIKGKPSDTVMKNRDDPACVFGERIKYNPRL